MEVNCVLGVGHGFHLLVPVGHVGSGLEYRFTPHIALLPTSGAPAKLVRSSQIWLTTTLSRSISLSGTPSKVKR
jgi:hypothetical protein